MVTTAWNEEAIIRSFCSQVTDVLVAHDCPHFEIVVIDNGSTDATLDILKELNGSDSRVRYVSLSRNFGHQGGLSAGMAHCTGDVAVTLDADLQHPPSVIPEMLDLWEQGFDVVNTFRQTDDHLPPTRRLMNRAFYRGLSSVSGMSLNESQSDFRLLDRCALDALNALPEKSRFLRGLVHWVGFRQTSIPYRPALRQAGKTKFALLHLLSFAVSGVLSFSVMPLRMFTFAGLSVAAASIGYAIYAAAVALVSGGDQMPPGWASLAVAVSFMGGVQLIGIGLVGEYVGRVLAEVHARPTFIVRERSNDG